MILFLYGKSYMYIYTYQPSWPIQGGGGGGGGGQSTVALVHFVLHAGMQGWP